jgi:hypothetical protein
MIDLTNIEQAKAKLEELNPLLVSMGFARLEIVKPSQCLAQKKNAQYFDVQTFNQLVQNIKNDKRLEGTPLAYEVSQENDEVKQDENAEPKQRKFGIISGHHRIDACRSAGVEYILIMVIDLKGGKDELRSKQISHNALVGKDDETVLKELFEEIKSIEYKIQSGLNSEIEKINYSSLNFKIGSFKNIAITFLPEDEERFNETVKDIEQFLTYQSGTSVYLAPLEIYDKFADALRRVKKVENIKSNGTAILRLAEYAIAHIDSLKQYQEPEPSNEEPKKKGK